jgi:hypothetical protein
MMEEDEKKQQEERKGEMRKRVREKVLETLNRKA